MTLEQLAELVREMRQAQTTFFQARKKGLSQVAEEALRNSKFLENRVDFALEEVLGPSGPQTNLFSNQNNKQ